MSSTVVRLAGDEEDVLAVTRIAARSIARDRETARDLFPRLQGLAHERRRAIALQRRGLAAPSPAQAEKTLRRPLPRIGTVLWGTALTLAALGALMIAALVGPPSRRGTGFREFDDFESVLAYPSLAIGVAMIVLLLSFPIPRGQATEYGTVVPLIVAAMLGYVAAYLLFTGGDNWHRLDRDQLAFWIPALIVSIVLLIALAVRCGRERRRRATQRDPRPAENLHSRAAIRERVRMAARLAGRSPRLPKPVLAHWAEKLDLLAAKNIVGHDTIAQARTMDPRAWLVWAFYDGDIPVTGILERA